VKSISVPISRFDEEICNILGREALRFTDTTTEA